MAVKLTAVFVATLVADAPTTSVGGQFAGERAAINDHIDRLGRGGVLCDGCDMHAGEDIGKRAPEDQPAVADTSRAAGRHIEQLRAAIAAAPRAPIHEQSAGDGGDAARCTRCSSQYWRVESFVVCTARIWFGVSVV